MRICNTIFSLMQLKWRSVQTTNFIFKVYAHRVNVHKMFTIQNNGSVIKISNRDQYLAQIIGRYKTSVLTYGYFNNSIHQLSHSILICDTSLKRKRKYQVIGKVWIFSYNSFFFLINVRRGSRGQRHSSLSEMT